MSNVIVAQTTTAKKDEAKKLAAALVNQRLAACVKVIGPIESVYRWQGAVESAEEWVCQIKTTTDHLEALIRAIRELHSYDEPEIVALPVVAGSETYLAWVGEQVGGSTSD